MLQHAVTIESTHERQSENRSKRFSNLISQNVEFQTGGKMVLLIDRVTTVKHGGGSIMLRVSLPAAETVIIIRFCSDLFL